MTALDRMQLRQPLHSQRVKRRDGVALSPRLNRADRVIRDAHAFRKSGLHESHGFAQRAEFCGGHGLGFFCGHAFNAGMIFAYVFCPQFIRRHLNGILSGFSIKCAPESAVCKYVERGHLNLSSMGLTALMNTGYSENIGIASSNSEISRKLQSQIVTKEAA